ncbi:MAG TPA: hypothetical protein DCY13_22345 [Verrucomicrobiales bacterium]|nr:hypothetical protein [Verrucomicrobiales bacterium]
MNSLQQIESSGSFINLSRPARAGLLAAFAVGGLVLPLQAEQPPDKRGYHLFNRTPRELLRDMSTDRPDQTESPNTVDAGWFQVEMDFVNAGLDRDRSSGADVETTDISAGALNLKAGLLHNVDIQFVLDSYVHSRVEDRVAGTVNEASGFGDLTTRLKINFWGNDGGRTSFGIMPFVKWPLPESGLRNGRTEGGVIVPFGMDLGGGWGLGAMTEFDFVSNGMAGYDVEYFNTLTVGRDLIGDLGAYVEFAALVTPESGNDWQGQVGLGFTYAFCADAQLDWGCNFGVTDSATDFNPFLGVSFRF